MRIDGGRLLSIERLPCQLENTASRQSGAIDTLRAPGAGHNEGTEKATATSQYHSVRPSPLAARSWRLCAEWRTGTLKETCAIQRAEQVVQFDGQHVALLLKARARTHGSHDSTLAEVREQQPSIFEDLALSSCSERSDPF